MPSQRRDRPSQAKLGHAVGDLPAADRHEQAAEAIRGLRNKIVHFSVSDPADISRTAYVEFELPMSEPVVAIFSILLENEQERNSKLKELYDRVALEPSAKVLAALNELEQAGTWFGTKEELFDALEAAGEGQGR